MCLVQNGTATYICLIQDKVCSEGLSDKNKLEMNSECSFRRTVLKAETVSLKRVENAFLDDGGRSFCAGWRQEGLQLYE